MNFEAITHIGNIRDNNEDFYYVSDDLDFPLFMVADGIGGRSYGELASKMTVEYIRDNLSPKSMYKDLEELEKDIVKVISDINKLVYEESNKSEEYNGMGTTLSLVYVYDKTLLIGNIGDSRVYSIGNNQIRQLTEDDTYVNALVKIGEITEDEAKDHPKKNLITNAIGTSVDVDINIIEYNFKSGELILLCTDGLTDMIDDKQILEVFDQNKDLDIIKDTLLEKALDAGGNDNITLIIVSV